MGKKTKTKIIGLCHIGMQSMVAETKATADEMLQDLRVKACHKLCESLGYEDRDTGHEQHATGLLDEPKTENGE